MRRRTPIRKDAPLPASDRDEHTLCVHIFSVSAGMVGVCLTVIGLVRIVQELQDLNTLADDLLAVDALGFLASCLLSYLSLRSSGARRARLERSADYVFLSALGGMAGACAMITYRLI